MKTPPAQSRVHRYFFWLAIYWGAISIVLFVLNPVGDLLDTYHPGFPDMPLVETLTWIGWHPLPFNSLQLLVGISAPIIALWTGFRFRWTAYVGVFAGALYLLFTTYALLNASERAAELRHYRIWPEECYAVGALRIVGSVTWIAAAVPLLWQLQRRRKATTNQG